jgi:hypothetical protein
MLPQILKFVKDLGLEELGVEECGCLGEVLGHRCGLLRSAGRLYRHACRIEACLGIQAM